MASVPTQNVIALAAVALAQTTPVAKIAATQAAFDHWQENRQLPARPILPPECPGRPDRPILLPPREMPRRRHGKTPRHRAALLHALCHIELNAVDLAWDLLVRFWTPEMPHDFVDDWTQVAIEEARHFTMLRAQLQTLGWDYGDFPAHTGLWESAARTRHDLLARLAVVPLVLEARGLDVTPAMINRLKSYGDDATVQILTKIYADEIDHVAKGMKWFRFFCASQKLNPTPTYQERVRRYFSGQIKGPFNGEARQSAGLEPEYYLPLAAISS